MKLSSPFFARSLAWKRHSIGPCMEAKYERYEVHYHWSQLIADISQHDDFHRVLRPLHWLESGMRCPIPCSGKANLTPSEPNRSDLAHANRGFIAGLERPRPNQPWQWVGGVEWHTRRMAPRRGLNRAGSGKAKKKKNGREIVELPPVLARSLPSSSSYLPFPSPSGPARTAFANLPQGPFSSFYCSPLPVDRVFHRNLRVAALSRPPRRPTASPASLASSSPLPAVAWLSVVSQTPILRPVSLSSATTSQLSID